MQIRVAGHRLCKTKSINITKGKNMTKKLAALTLSTALVALAAPALAQSQGDWTLGIGVGYLDPKSDNGTLAGAPATIDADTRPIFTAEYFIRDNLGIELLAATPFKHTVALGGTDAGTVKREACKNGMRTLREDGALKVLMGHTSIAEVVRVTSEGLSMAEDTSMAG